MMSFAGRGMWIVYSDTDEIILSWGAMVFRYRLQNPC